MVGRPRQAPILGVVCCHSSTVAACLFYPEFHDRPGRGCVGDPYGYEREVVRRWERRFTDAPHAMQPQPMGLLLFQGQTG